MGWFSRLFGRNKSETLDDSAAEAAVSRTPPDEQSDPTVGLNIDVGGMWERLRYDRLMKHYGVTTREEVDQKDAESDAGMQGYAVRLAYLDRKTCPACRSLDSKVVAIDSTEYNEFMPPKKCTARECRCEYIVSSADQRP